MPRRKDTPRIRTPADREGQKRYKATHRDKATHAAVERARYYAKRGLVAPETKQVHVRGGAPRRIGDLPPLIDAPTGHQVYEDARQFLTGWERTELGGDMDSTARDLLQEYALARLENRDPVEAVKTFRRAAYHDRMVLVHGLAVVDDLSR